MNLRIVILCLCVFIFVNAEDDRNKRSLFSNIQYSEQNEAKKYQNLIQAEYQKYYAQRNAEVFQKLFPYVIAASIPASLNSNEEHSTSSQNSNSNIQTSYSYKSSLPESSSYALNENRVVTASLHTSNRNTAEASSSLISNRNTAEASSSLISNRNLDEESSADISNRNTASLASNKNKIITSYYPSYIPYGYNAFLFPELDGSAKNEEITEKTTDAQTTVVVGVRKASNAVQSNTNDHTYIKSDSNYATTVQNDSGDQNNPNGSQAAANIINYLSSAIEKVPVAQSEHSNVATNIFANSNIATNPQIYLNAAIQNYLNSINANIAATNSNYAANFQNYYANLAAGIQNYINSVNANYGNGVQSYADFVAGIQNYINSVNTNFAAGIQQSANSAADIATYVASIEDKEENKIQEQTNNANSGNVVVNPSIQLPEKESFIIINGSSATTPPLVSVEVPEQNKKPDSVIDNVSVSSFNSNKFGEDNSATATISHHPGSWEVAPFVSTILGHKQPVKPTASGNIVNPSANSPDIAPFVSTILGDNKLLHSTANKVQNIPLDSDVAPFVSETREKNSSTSAGLVSDQVATPVAIDQTIPPEIKTTEPTSATQSIVNRNNGAAQASTTNNLPSEKNEAFVLTNINNLSTEKTGVFLLAVAGNSNNELNRNGYKFIRIGIPNDVLKKLLAENDEKVRKNMMASIESNIAIAVEQANSEALIKNKSTEIVTRVNNIDETNVQNATENVAVTLPNVEKSTSLAEQIVALTNPEANSSESTSTANPVASNTTEANIEASTQKDGDIAITFATPAPTSTTTSDKTTPPTNSEAIFAPINLSTEIKQNIDTFAETLAKLKIESDKKYLIPIDGGSAYFIQFLPEVFYTSEEDEDNKIFDRFANEDAVLNSKQEKNQKVISLDTFLNQAFKIKQSSSIKNVNGNDASAFIVTENDKNGPRIVFKFPKKNIQAANAVYASSSGNTAVNYVSNSAHESYRENKYYRYNSYGPY